MTDFELITAYAQRGDREAIGALIGRYVDLVYGAALRQVRDREVAEDVTQGVFLLLLQKAGGFGAGVRVGSWLLQATYYACLRAGRDLRRREYHERKAAGERREEAVGEGAGDRAWVDGALRKLRERDREAVVLRFMRGLALAEVGAQLGISEEAARKRVDRAVEKLRGLAPTPAEAQAMGVGAVIGGIGVRAPEGVMAKVMSQVGGSAGAAGGAAAHCATWAATGFVMAKVKVAAAVLVAAMAAGAGAVVLPQVVGGTAKQAVAATGPAPVKPGATRNDLALACWGAVVSEDVAEAAWRQSGGTGDRFAPKAAFVVQKTGVETGRGDAGKGQADAIRAVFRQALEDEAKTAWAIWAPAVNRIAGPDGKFRFEGPKREGQMQWSVEGPAGRYRQNGDDLAANVDDGWYIEVRVPGVAGHAIGADQANRLRLGEAAVIIVQVPESRQWLVVVWEPWRVAAGSNVQRAAESFPHPGPWVRGGPELAERWYQEADRVVPRVAGADPRRLTMGDEVIVERIDDEAEVRVPFVRDMERNALIGFGARSGRPLQFSFSTWGGHCRPMQKRELEVPLFIFDPRVVFGYKEDGTPVTLDDQMNFHMLAYVPRRDEQFEREFGTGEYERLGRCEAKVGEMIRLGEDAAVRVKEVGAAAVRTDMVPQPVQERYSVTVEGRPPDDGEYVVVGVDEQERPHFPMRYAPMRGLAEEGNDPRPRVKDGVYAVRGELKAVEVWRRPWKKVVVKGYAREVRVEGK